MAYATIDNVVALSNNQLLAEDIQDVWVTWNDFKVDTLLNLGFSFKLYKDNYSFILQDLSAREIFLRSPIVANQSYVTKVYEDDTAYPSISDTETSAEDYLVRSSFLERTRDTNWKRYLTIEYHWGFENIPTEVEVLANLTLLNFSLLTKVSSSTVASTERIGEYQYSSTNVETTTSSFSDEIKDLTAMVRTKYSTVNFTFPGVQDPSPTLINPTNSSIVAT